MVMVQTVMTELIKLVIRSVQTCHFAVYEKEIRYLSCRVQYFQILTCYEVYMHYIAQTLTFKMNGL